MGDKLLEADQEIGALIQSIYSDDNLEAAVAYEDRPKGRGEKLGMGLATDCL